MNEQLEEEFLDEIRELAKCTVCYQYMLGPERRPTAILCGHLICKTCCNQLTVRDGNKKMTECPECRAVTVVNTDLSPIYQIEKMCQIVANYVPMPIFCSNCLSAVNNSDRAFCEGCWEIAIDRRTDGNEKEVKESSCSWCLPISRHCDSPQRDRKTEGEQGKKGEGEQDEKGEGQDQKAEGATTGPK